MRSTADPHPVDLSAGLTSLEWKYAILNAVEQWNNGANGGWFDFDGTTDTNFSPPNMCDPDEQVNVVRIGYKDDGSGVCDNPDKSILGNFRHTCDGNNWMVTLCATNRDVEISCVTAAECPNQTGYVCDAGRCMPNYSVGALPSPGFDVQGILAHELGHTLGLKHPQGSQTAIMGNSPGHLRKRELYPFDIECQERLYGRRSQPIYYRRQGHNALTFDGTIYTMALGYARGLGNVRVDTNGTAHLAAIAYSYRFRNSTGFTLSNSPTNMYQQYVGAFTNAWFREVPDRWRTMYLYDYDSINRYENVNSVNNVWQYAYDHSFTPGDLTDGRMNHCTSSSIYCYPDNIHTYHPISVAYDHAASDRTIFAWVNATRQNGADDREIWISVGTRLNTERTLNQPFKTGIRSSTNVAVACGPFGSADGFYNCIIVYSPLSHTSYGLYLRRFFVHGSDYMDYDLEWDAETTSIGWLTGSNATAWYANGWRVAHTSGTGIQVRESTDSTSWSHSETLQQPVGAPQAITVGEPGDRTTRLYFTGR